MADTHFPGIRAPQRIGQHEWRRKIQADGGGNARRWEWQKNLYAFLSRNARPVKDYYQIMPTQIIEIGLPVQL